MLYLRSSQKADKVHWKVNSKSFKRPSGNTRYYQNKLKKKWVKKLEADKTKSAIKKIILSAEMHKDIKQKLESLILAQDKRWRRT